MPNEPTPKPEGTPWKLPLADGGASWPKPSDDPQPSPRPRQQPGAGALDPPPEAA